MAISKKDDFSGNIPNYEKFTKSKRRTFDDFLLTLMLIKLTKSLLSSMEVSISRSLLWEFRQHRLYELFTPARYANFAPTICKAPDIISLRTEGISGILPMDFTIEVADQHFPRRTIFQEISYIVRNFTRLNQKPFMNLLTPIPIKSTKSNYSSSSEVSSYRFEHKHPPLAMDFSYRAHRFI